MSPHIQCIPNELLAINDPVIRQRCLTRISQYDKWEYTRNPAGSPAWLSYNTKGYPSIEIPLNQNLLGQDTIKVYRIQDSKNQIEYWLNRKSKKKHICL